MMASDCGADSRRRYPYPFLTTNAASAASRSYDYIIVGGGAAGCPLATTLSEKYKVLLLERGDSPYGDPDIEDESGFLKPLSKADEYYSVAQNFVTEDGVKGTRGRVLGGSTCLNAGFYSRGSVPDIAAMKLSDSVLIQQSYEWVEEQVSFKPKLGAFHGAFRDSLLRHGLQPDNGYTLEHKPGTKTSDSIFDNDGKRHTAADLLKHADRHNIVVLLKATAKRILFGGTLSKHRAVGVEFVNRENTVTHHVSLRGNGEVILCAGALGSPQLLLLSGIGPSDHLTELGIPVVHNLPGVGQKIGDNPKTDLYMLLREPCDVLLVQVVGILERPYLEFRKCGHPNAVFLSEGRNPNVYIEEGTLVKDAPDGKEAKQAYLGWLTHKLGHPVSTGELRLRTLDPRDNPSVRYNYYSHPFDLDAAVKGTRLLANILRSDQIRSFGYENPDDAPEYLKKALAEQGPPLPHDLSDDEAMRRFCKEAMTTIWHYHGGCHLGSVLHMNYKVMGVDGVRVVDASAFKSSPGTNPQATLMMLGRYKGVEITRERE